MCPLEIVNGNGFQLVPDLEKTFFEDTIPQFNRMPRRADRMKDLEIKLFGSQIIN